ncbi:DUF3987 domain-containing protein [Microcoleus sp. FACHB-831]|uniref:DUF3987 domain-containing protein n=1 Tax=Microcoleus sp. FACHB-831 TaxID=2692827 RepID=UPI001684AA78|nr:DUF3987 domain-containing protein [Microcoleus sp. FACHB-831]MBD1919541.1 DUF3987 domain-containing protein [Microcoleus sp. FACHB-831]
MDITPKHFAIRELVDFDAKGRAACPSCLEDGKKGQKNLFVNSDGKYWCYRGCNTAQIRAALGAPPPSQPINLSGLLPIHYRQKSATQKAFKCTVTQKQLEQSNKRLLHRQGTPQQQALLWLEARGFSQEMIRHYRLGLEQRWITPNENKPETRECYWSIAIYIPTKESGQFYKKMRVAPWLVGDTRPDYVSKWCQYGVPATIWFTYLPENAEATWYCEGEWDAMRLGWLARQQKAKVAVCCSTAGCNTVPKQEHLKHLPGIITIFFDRNDEPRKDGTIPGDEGAKKLANALAGRGRIAKVPMPDGCDLKGWDVSNALDAGYTWSDFQAATILAKTELDRQQNQSQNNQFDSPSPHPLTAAGTRSVEAMSLRDRILEILDRYDTPSLRDVALMDLARTSRYPYREVEKLAKDLAIEVDLQTDQAEAAKKLANLIKTQPTQLNLYRYLEPWFAEIVTQTALAMPTAPEFLFTTLLPAAASRVGTAARIVIKPSVKYTQPLVFWTAIVANSGSMKTPAQRVILDPLVALETEAYKSYLEEQADYQAEQEANKRKKPSSETSEKPLSAPTRKRYLTKDITLETLQRIHGQNPRGLLYYRDELAANTKARNQYRGGHGADEEAELDQWNGGAILYDRAEKSVCLPRSAISRTGGYQWEVLGKLMGDHKDFNGNFARWLFCAAKTPLRYLRLLEEEQDTGISEALTYLYVELEKVPEQDYLLSHEAKQLLEIWQHQLVDAQLAEDDFGLQVAFPKIEAYTARLALWLHIVNAVLRGERPSQVVNGDTMEKAIELAAYYMWQYRLIHTHNSPDAGLAGLGLKVQKFAERTGQVTASTLKSGIRTLRKMANEQIRQLMQTLASAGYGRIVGKESQMVYIPLPVNTSSQDKKGEDRSGSSCQFVSSVTKYAVMTKVGSVDRNCHSECQLSTVRTDTSEDGSPSEISGQGLTSISKDSISKIDAIDTPLAEVSMPEPPIRQGFQVSVDTIDTNEGTHKKSALSDLSIIEMTSSKIDVSDATFEREQDAHISLSDTDTSTPSWKGFKVGERVMLSYYRIGVSAAVIDPAQHPKMAAQPGSDYVPIMPTDTGRPEWYPAAWVRSATAGAG